MPIDKMTKQILGKLSMETNLAGMIVCGIEKGEKGADWAREKLLCHCYSDDFPFPRKKTDSEKTIFLSAKKYWKKL